MFAYLGDKKQEISTLRENNIIKQQELPEEQEFVIIPLENYDQGLNINENKKQNINLYDCLSKEQIQDILKQQKQNKELTQIIVFDEEQRNEKNIQYSQNKNVKNIQFTQTQFIDNSAVQFIVKARINLQKNECFKQQQITEKINILKQQQYQDQVFKKLKGIKISKTQFEDNIQINILDKKVFSLAKLPPGITLKCILKKTSSIYNFMSPQFDLYIQNGLKHIVSAKKYPFRNKQIFKFSTDPIKFDQKQSSIAVMHANISHNIYWLLDQPKRIKQIDLSFIHLVVGYYKIIQSQINRSFSALLPQTQGKYKLAMQYEQNFINFSNFKQQIQTQINNLIDWQIPLNALHSNKNFAMADQDDKNYRYLQMYKISQNVFQISIQHPLSPLQALAIALTRFDVQLN